MSAGFVRARLNGSNRGLFKPIFAVEADQFAAETYELNLKHEVVTRPIEDVPDDDFPLADVVIGGPPCQGFSALNRQREGDLRRKLWEEYARTLELTEAAYF